jgi:hypothetical protein
MEEEAAVSSAEENVALARRFMEARVKGNLEAVDEMMAPDYVNHTSLLSVQEPDREGVKWATAQLSAAISNPSIPPKARCSASRDLGRSSPSTVGSIRWGTYF